MNLTPPEADDWNLVFDSWAKSWMKSPWSGTIRNCDYAEVSRKTFEEIIDRPTTVVTIASTLTEAGERRIMGYSVSEPSRGVIHWIYVKRDFRGIGVARALLKDIIGTTQRGVWNYTHKTNACTRLFRGMTHDKSYACAKPK